MTIATLPLHDLAERHPGLTPAIGQCYVEAAGICLDRHFSPPESFEIQTLANNVAAKVSWKKADAGTLSAWANETDATEFGAYGMALAAIEFDDLVAVRRAETRTGADYYLAPVGTQADDLENWRRLEVSGVDGGDTSVLSRRLAQKVDQALNGTSNLPALVAVVGFGTKRILIATADAQ